jgi:D-sedoheptulose 7-phosphate isomerase
MMDAPRARVDKVFEATILLHERVRQMELTPVTRAAAAIGEAFAHGGRLFVFGNGGSAADAQHMAAEMVGRFARERRALPALALTTDTSVLTSVANDYNFERVFVRQIEALGRPGDVAFGISTSGDSANVLRAIEAAKAGRLQTVALTGRDGGLIGAAAEIHINVPDDSTARVQEVHRTLIHAICELVEDSIDA